jgi:UDP-N-acetylmuramoylalanine--D-glutamate ligase
VNARELRGRAVTVMGLGLQGGGVETVRFLVSRGARVTVTDQRPSEKLGESLAAIAGLDVRKVLGEHRLEDFVSADLVVANPAVAPSHPLLAAARERGVAVTSEMELFLQACPARLVLITGTQGKSSTTNAAAQLLEACGRRVHLGGNIGRALISSIDEMGEDDVAVVELSSYQLEALSPGFGPLPRVAAVACVNVLADHLERHGTIEAYEAAKHRILDLAPAPAAVVLPSDDPRVSRWVVARGRELRFSVEDRSQAPLHLSNGEFRFGSERLGRVADLRLPGEFQRANVLAALGLARALGASPDALAAAVSRLAGLEHRLEDLGLFAGHRVWDNGVSTTPDSTLSALLALARPLTLLCGGQAKNLPLDELARAARERNTRVVTFGGSAEFLRRAFEAERVPVRAAPRLEDAVELAFAHLVPGEELLFSPACASFDAYRNFRDRALAFRAALPRSTAAVS